MSKKLALMNGKSYIIASVLFVFTLYFSFRNLLDTFFQQDEWYGFGKVLYAENQSLVYYFTNLSGSHINPFSVLFFSTMFHWFGLNSIAYNIIDIILHTLNAILVYLITFRLLGQVRVALLASIFFLTSSVSIQAVNWIGAAAGTLGCTFFALTSILSFTFFITEDLKRYLWASIILFSVSLGFQEESIFLVMVFPLLTIITFNQGGNLKRAIIKLLPFFGTSLLIAISRVLIFIVPMIFSEKQAAISQSSVNVPILDIGLHFFVYPLEGLSQVFIPYGVMYHLQSLYSVKDSFWSSKQLFGITASDWLSTGISVAVLIILFVVGKYILDTRERKVLSFSVLYILLSFTPYIIVAKGSSYLDSRYYYFASAGAAIVFSLVAHGLARWGASFVARDSLRKYAQYSLLALLTVPYLMIQVLYVRQDIAKALEVSTVRKKAVSFIEKQYPVIGNKTVFYVESDTPHYGLAEKFPPFQSGFGQMLMVIFAQKGQLNAEFFRDNFLWDILSEGYDERNGQGFGYFRNIDDVRRIVVERNLSADDVFAIRFTGDKASNITEETRRRVQFSSDEDLLKNILYGKEFSGYDKRLVWFDMKNKLSTQEIELVGVQGVGTQKDKLYTARLYTHAGWIGASLTHYKSGLQGKKLTLPKMVYGYDVVSIGSVKKNGTIIPIEKLVKNEDGDWDISLEQSVNPSDIVEFGLWVSVRQLDFDGKKKSSISQYDISDVKVDAETRVLRSKIMKTTDSIVLQMPGKVGSFPVNDKGESVVFVNGVMTEVKSVTSLTPSTLEIIFKRNLFYGDKVDLPVFIETSLEH